MVDNCKHVNRIKNCLGLGILQPDRWQCQTCFTTESVWACLSCPNIACGRYIEEHALCHYQETNHPLCIEVNEKFVYCYECDDYILNDNAPGDIKLIRMALSAVTEQEFEQLKQVKGGRRILRSKVIHNDSYKSRRLLHADHIQTALVKLRLSRLTWALHKWNDVLHKRQQLRESNTTTSSVTTSSGSQRRRDRSNSGSSATTATSTGPTGRRNQSDPHSRSGRLIPYSGLRNLGNTCYINSVIQVLSHTGVFSNFIVTHPPESVLPGLRDSYAANSATSSSQLQHRRRNSSTNCFDVVDSPMKRAAVLTTQSERLLNQQQQRALGAASNSSTVGKRGKLSSSAAPSSSSSASSCGLNGGSTELQHPETITYAAQPATSLYEELHALFRVLWSGQRAVVSPHSLLYALWIAVPTFKGYKQQDAQEFLSVLLDKMQTELQPSGEKWDPLWQNFVTRAFQGELENRIRCCNCEHEVRNQEPFLDLSLSFPPQVHYSSNSTQSATSSTTSGNQKPLVYSLDDLLTIFSAETPIESPDVSRVVSNTNNNRKGNEVDDPATSAANPSTQRRRSSTRSAPNYRHLHNGTGVFHYTSGKSNSASFLEDQASSMTRVCYVCPRCCTPSNNTSSSSTPQSTSTMAGGTTLAAADMNANFAAGPWPKLPADETPSSPSPSTKRHMSPKIVKEEKVMLRNQALVEATQTLRISRLPKVLRLHLKRFRWIGRQREKISAHVAFPAVLDMSRLCTAGLVAQHQALYALPRTSSQMSLSGLAACEEEMSGLHYQLTAVIVHHGKGFQSGHYTSYVLDDETDTWLHYNDAQVTPCSLAEVLSAQAYILVYSQLLPTAVPPGCDRLLQPVPSTSSLANMESSLLPSTPASSSPSSSLQHGNKRRRMSSSTATKLAAS